MNLGTRLALPVIGFCAGLLFASLAHGAEWRVVDGDTIRQGQRIVRIYGIDAPETHQPKCAVEKALGLEAQAFLRDQFTKHRVRVVSVKRKTRDGQVVPSRDKYGRDLARVFVDGQNVGDLLIAAGLAKPYFGAKKETWCP